MSIIPEFFYKLTDAEIGDFTIVNDGDILMGVDISDATQSPDGTSKRLPVNILKTYILSDIGGYVPIDGTTELEPITGPLILADNLYIGNYDPIDSSEGSTVKFEGPKLTLLSTSITGGLIRIELNPDALPGDPWAAIKSDIGGFSGLEYGGDYAPDFRPNSLVTKAWVQSQLGGTIPNLIYGGPGIPDNSLGLDDDYYISTTYPSPMYIRVDGIWEIHISRLVGTNGIDGIDGNHGIDGANARRWTNFSLQEFPNSSGTISAVTGVGPNFPVTFTPSEIARIKANEFDDTGADMNAWFVALRTYLITNPGKAYIQLTQTANNSIFGIYQITGSINKVTTFYEIFVTYIAGSVGTFNGFPVTLSWVLFGANSVGGNSLTSLDGDTTPDQTFSIGTSGTVPSWTSLGAGDRRLRIPLASNVGVTAGLVSNVDLVKAFAAYSAAFPYIESSYLSTGGCFFTFIDVANDRLYLPGSFSGFLTIIQASTGDLIALVNVGVNIPQTVYRVESINEIWLMGNSTLTYRYSLLGVPLVPATFTFGAVSKDFIEFSPTKVICTTGSSGNAIQFINPVTRVISSSITTIQLGINNACFAMVENKRVGSLHFGLVAVTARNLSTISLINPTTETVVATAVNPSSLLNQPAYLVHSNLSDKYYVANTTPNSIVVLEPATATTFAVVTEIRGIINPYGIAIDQATGLVYVAGGTPSTVILTIINSVTNKIVRVSAGLRQATTAPIVYSITLDLANGYAYVTDHGASGANFATTTKFKIF